MLLSPFSVMVALGIFKTLFFFHLICDVTSLALQVNTSLSPSSIVGYGFGDISVVGSSEIKMAQFGEINILTKSQPIVQIK